MTGMIAFIRLGSFILFLDATYLVGLEFKVPLRRSCKAGTVDLGSSNLSSVLELENLKIIFK